jgi:hypothetical protein
MLLGSGPTDSARSNGASPVFAILFAGRRRPKNRDWTQGGLPLGEQLPGLAQPPLPSTLRFFPHPAELSRATGPGERVELTAYRRPDSGGANE